MARSNWKLSDDALLSRPSKAFSEPLGEENVIDIYDRVRHLMSEEHREYLDQIQRGDGKVDPVMELEMNLRLVSILSTQAVEWALRDGKVPKDVSSLLGEVRQSATAIEDIKRKREELRLKRGDNEQVVDPTRESTLARFQGLFGEDSGE